jgi:iron complex outermembrane recepter protein
MTAGEVAIHHGQVVRRKRRTDGNGGPRGKTMRTNMKVAAAVAWALSGATALAADPADAVLQEVTVSAERRSTLLQDTPISIQTVSAEAMLEKGIEDVADIALFTPNLAITGSRGTGNNSPSFSIRGISGGGGATGERGVALYIDDIFVPRTAGSVFKVFDLERVEVLRGPQGTNFGRNSQGGAVRLLTKQPKHEFEAYARAVLGNQGRRDLIGMVNLPMNDTMAVRLQVARLEQDGFVSRGPTMLGGFEDWLGRAQFLWDISDTVRLNVNALYSDSRSEGTPNVMRRWDMAPGINGPDVPANVAIQGNYADWISDWLQSSGQPRLATVDDPRVVRDPYTAPSFCFLDDADPDWDPACNLVDNNKYYQLDAKVRWDLSEKTTLTFSGGYNELDHDGISDWVFLGVESRPDIVRSKVLNGEVLLNTALFGGKVDFVSGLNLFQEKSGTEGINVSARGTSVFNSVTGGAANGNGRAGLYGVGNLTVDQTARSAGLFTSATWHITKKLNFTGGLRGYYEEKAIRYNRGPGFGPAPTFPGMAAANDFVPSYPGANGARNIVVNGDDSWRVLDWRATADYHFTDDIMMYATASKAFRAGYYAYVTTANLSPAAQESLIRPLDPEKVINLESGLRTTWLDGRLRINPTGYYMAWTNRQSSQQQACPNNPECPTGFRIILVNSGAIDVYGLEMDVDFAITRQLMFNGSLGTTKYKVRDPVANAGPNLFPDQPTPSWNAGLSYNAIPTRAGNLNLNLNYVYRGPMQTHPSGLTFPAATVDSSYQLPGFGLWNSRISLELPSGNTTVSLFANNLTDKVYGTYATRFGGGFWDAGGPAPSGRAAPPRSALAWVMGRPREIGLMVQHNF